MKNKSLTDSLAELNDVVKHYIEARIRLMQMVLLDKFTRAGTFLITSIVVVMAVFFVILLLTLAFSYWYGENYGSIIEGFIISAAFYILLTLIIYWLRKPLISNTIIKSCSDLFFIDKDKEEEK